MAFKHRRRFCRNLTTELATQGVSVAKRTVIDRILESGSKAYSSRKKPRLTEPMLKARLTWAKNHV